MEERKLRRRRISTVEPKSAQEALSLLRERCSKSEVSVSDAIRLLDRWSVEPEKRDEIITSLERDKFIDQQRYAMAFVRDKINFSHWGSYKIEQELRLKKIPSEFIEQALEQIDKDGMTKRLANEMRRKRDLTKFRDKYELKGKLVRFAVSRGYDYEISSTLADSLIEEMEQPENQE